MTFGHGVFDHMAGNPTFASEHGEHDHFAKVSYISHNEAGAEMSNPYRVEYSALKTEGVAIQWFPTKEAAMSAANEHEPSGIVVYVGDDPIDAVMREWSEWSDCEDGLTTRSRTVKIPAFNEGITPPLSEEEVCGEEEEEEEPEDDEPEDSDSWMIGLPLVTPPSQTITTQSSAVAIVAPAEGMDPLLKMGIVLAGIGLITFFVS